MTDKQKKILKLTLKIVVSGAAIAFVVHNIDVAATWRITRSASVPWLLAALVVYTASQLLSALRLKQLFDIMPLPLGKAANVRLYWLGMFYNFFLPGGVGGDGYKVYYLNRRHRLQVKDLVAAVFADRLSGLTAIAVYLLVFSSFFIENLPIPFREYLFLLAPVVVGAYVLFLRLTMRRLSVAAWRVVGFSIIIQGLQMTTAAFILLSLSGEPCTVDSYLFLFLVSSVASAIPVTLGGIGAREMAFVIGSTILGTSQDVAVSLSLLFYAVSLVSSLPGLVYVLRPSLIEGREAADIEAEKNVVQ